MLVACGKPEEKVYGYWMHEDHSLAAYGYGISISAFELTKDTYRNNLLTTPLNPNERAIYYESSEDQIVVRDVASNEAILVIRGITKDNITVLTASQKIYSRATLSEIEETRHSIAESSNR